MAFGKPGRPPEDRLARQQEIYTAVAPLLLQVGVRSLAMQDAAEAACLSIGGLYHYFPSKRALALHALEPTAVVRCCQDFHAAYGHLVATDPAQYLAAKLDFMIAQVGFRRASVHAALELGSTTFWEVIESSLTAGLNEFGRVFQSCYPALETQRQEQMSRALRRTLVAALLDKQLTVADLRAELCAVINGYTENRSLAPESVPEAISEKSPAGAQCESTVAV